MLERVVAARSMARDGIAKTCSPPCGEVSPVEDYLRQLVAAAEPGEVPAAGSSGR